jgi:hypothetical protein
MTEFKPFPKMARLSRECLITEKIDGTNASIFIGPADFNDSKSIATLFNKDGSALGMWAGSRTRWITTADDNFGFANWAVANASELFKLGVGHHFGEWWGSGIQRGYGFKNGERFFSLFNAVGWVAGDDPIGVASVSWDPETKEMTPKLQERAPACCKVVPILDRCLFDDTYDDAPVADCALWLLGKYGSKAAPNYMNPEGVVVYHIAGNVGFKKTFYNDGQPKSKQ